MRFSEKASRAVGLPPQQHQALLAIKGQEAHHQVTVGWLAERLLIAPHTSTELISRLVDADLVRRSADVADGRRQILYLTLNAEALLAQLSDIHLKEIRLLAPELIAVLQKLSLY